ncbi:MAG: hypothetical protein QOJ50_3191 [Cryptosporangiaceae bacterium]|nr:hypothetical protein [Cryptosporangiaceae bacterium]
MRSTIAEALSSARGLHYADAGRLRGLDPRSRCFPLTELAQLGDPWIDDLLALIRARAGGTITPDTPEYVVLSDGLPVAWLTVHAAVITPSVPLTRIQARHQGLAAAALGDLHRYTLTDLADWRDRREDRTADGIGEAAGSLRVASAADPTRTARIRIGPDPARAAATADAVIHSTGGPLLILSASGYGRYRGHAHRLDLGILCAMHAIADEHQVPLPCIGDWIDDDPCAAGLTAAALPQRFRDTYRGQFSSREAYTEHCMDAQGWTAVLRQHGMEPFFDQRDYTHHLFTRDVTAIDGHAAGHRDSRGGVHVFRRPQ